MTWAAPEYSWLLLLLLPAYFVARRGERRRRHNLHLLGFLANHPTPARLFFRYLYVAAIYLMIVAALCRPMWGTQIERQESKGLDIIIALDTSRSMLADDVPPTRLTAAKKAIVALIDKLQGDRIGLIAFAGSAFLVCPLTSDYSAFRQMLDETGINTIPRGGSDLGSILKEVSDGFGETGSRSRLLILVSDGEDHGVSTAAVAGRLRESGVVICCVTVGSDAGSIIPLPDGNFLKDREGNIVRSRTNPATLDLFSGRNVRLGTNSDTIVKLYEDVRPLLLQRSVTRSQKLQIERFQFPLAAAVLLLVLGPFLSIRKRI